MIAELCSHMIALDCRQSQLIARIEHGSIPAIACDRDCTRSHTIAELFTYNRRLSLAIECDLLRSSAIICEPGFSYQIWCTPGTLIALHHGRKTKSESFASCRGRVNISGGSKIAWINVECNGIHCLLPFLRKLKSVCGPLRLLLFLRDKGK